MHQTKHPEFLNQVIPSYATVFYGQKNIRIMLLCGLYKSAGQNYLLQCSFVVTKYDEGVLEGQVVFAVIYAALLCVCRGHHDVDEQGLMFPDVTSYQLKFERDMGSSDKRSSLTKFRGILVLPFLGPSGLRRFYTAQHSKRLQSSYHGMLHCMTWSLSTVQPPAWRAEGVFEQSEGIDFSLSTPRRRRGGAEVQLHSFLTSALDV